jgi:hypothetical protein
MMLIFIYSDIKNIANRLYPNQSKKQRKLEQEIICTQEGIAPRSELRLKTSAMRIRCIIDAGINFNQIIEVGMNISDFEVENKYYNKFLLALNLRSIRELNEKAEPLLDPINVRPKIPNILKNLLEISEMELDN